MMSTFLSSTRPAAPGGLSGGPRRVAVIALGALIPLTFLGCRDTGNGTTEPNLPPSTPVIASPSAGGNFAPGEEITFEGSASDPEDGMLTGASLTWTSSVDGQIGVGATFSRDDLSEGLHTITLRAEDSEGLSSVASVAIQIQNQPPQPVIGAPQDGATYALGVNIGFQGGASDPEDGTLSGSSLVWSSDVDGELGDGTSFTRSDLSAGEHVITLTATDSGGREASTSVSITVRPPPTASIALPAQGAQFLEGESVDFQGSGSGADGPLTGASLVWTSTLDGQIGTGTSFTRDDLGVGVHTVTLTATDAHGLTASTSVGITVIGAGGAPTVEILSPADGATLSGGTAVTFQGTATDPEDGTLGGASLVWTSDVDGDIGTGTSTTVSDLSLGTHVITLTATDSDARTGTASVTITLLSGPVASISSPSSGTTFDQGESIDFQGSATDEEDGTLTGGDLVWTSSRDGQIGTGTSFSRSDLSGGSHVITLTATDSDGISGSASVSITVQAGAPPSASISSPNNGLDVDMGTNVSFQGSATDPEDGPLTGDDLVWTSSRDGKIGTGTSFTRSALSVGSHTITLTATDSDGRTGTASVSITVDQTSAILVKVGSDAATDIGVGQETSLPIRVDLSEYSPATDDKRLASIQVRVTWDTGVATYASSSAGSFGNVIINDDDAGSGAVVAGTFAFNGADSSFTLFTLRLQGAAAGMTNVSVQVQTAEAQDGSDISSEVGTLHHGLNVGS